MVVMMEQRQKKNKKLETWVSLASDPLFVKNTLAILVAVNISSSSVARSYIVLKTNRINEVGPIFDNNKADITIDSLIPTRAA